MYGGVFTNCWQQWRRNNTLRKINATFLTRASSSDQNATARAK